MTSQWLPGLGAWVHPVSGGDAFPPAAWQILFITGMTVGYYRDTIRERFLTPNRKKLTWTLVILSVIMITVVTVQLSSFQFYNHESWDLYLWERHPLRFGRVLYFFLSASACYLLVQRASAKFKLIKTPFNALAVLGRNSLYAFLVHLGLAMVIGLVQIPPEQWFWMELIPVATVYLVYRMSLAQVGRKWIPN